MESQDGNPDEEQCRKQDGEQGETKPSKKKKNKMEIRMMAETIWRT